MELKLHVQDDHRHRLPIPRDIRVPNICCSVGNAQIGDYYDVARAHFPGSLQTAEVLVLGERVNPAILPPTRLRTYLRVEHRLEEICSRPPITSDDQLVAKLVLDLGELKPFFDCTCFVAMMANILPSEVAVLPRRKGQARPGDTLLFKNSDYDMHYAIFLGGDPRFETISKLGRFSLAITSREQLAQIYNSETLEVRRV